MALTQRQKRFVVEKFACFYTPTEVQRALQEEFGVGMELNALSHYNPTTVQGQQLSKVLTAFFWEQREKFCAETDGIAIAHKTYRLRELERLYQRAMRMGNLPLAQSLLESAAKEVGDVHTNKRILGGAVGLTQLSQLTDEQLERLAKGEPLEKVLQ